MMDAEKITQDMYRRFAEPLPEFYKRRNFSVLRMI